MLINPFMVAPARPAIPASTKILMPLTTADGFADIANNHAITVIGSPTISTAQSKFGAGSLRVSIISSGNYLRINSTSTLDMSGKKPFTFEFWVYLTSGHYNGSSILSTRGDTASCTNILVKRNFTLIGDAYLDNWSGVGAAIPLNQWVHVALVLDGTNIKEYINGVQTGSPSAHPSWPVGDKFLNVGYDFDGTIDGYINDLRISDYAVYTANFTPPTSPF